MRAALRIPRSAWSPEAHLVDEAGAVVAVAVYAEGADGLDVVVVEADWVAEAHLEFGVRGGGDVCAGGGELAGVGGGEVCCVGEEDVGGEEGVGF